MGEHAKAICRKVEIISITAAVLSWFYSIQANGKFPFFITGLLGLLWLVIFLLARDIKNKNPADSHSIYTLLLQYFISRIISFWGFFNYRQMIRNGRDIELYSAKQLKKILELNRDTEWGKLHGFILLDTPKKYIANHPLTSYHDYSEIIHRIAKNGEQDLLTKDKVKYLATSSGTTGKSKLIPVTDWIRSSRVKRMASIMIHVKSIASGLSLQRNLTLSYQATLTSSPCGIKQGPITSYMKTNDPSNLNNEVTWNINNEQASLYTLAVIGLAERELGTIDGFMSGLVYSFWKLIESRWQDICEDIEKGKIHEDINLTNGQKIKIQEFLYPDHERADELRQEFSKGFYNICKRVWPNMKSVSMLTSGSFAHYAKLLKEIYMVDIPQMSMIYAASEVMGGINLSPASENVQYTLYTEDCFYEFIHIDEEIDQKKQIQDGQPITKTMSEVQIGQSYELVVTNMMGLYRYRMGDILHIVNKIHGIPVFEFRYRSGQALNVYWEKTPENVFYNSVTKTAERLNIKIVDYTATESVNMENIIQVSEDKMSKCYIMLLELSPGQYLSKEELSLFDRTLIESFELYGKLREQEAIGPMEVVQVKPGTFLTLKASLIEKTQNKQFKMPRVMRNRAHLENLYSCKM